MKLVVNRRHEPFDVYVGRPGPYGNPFSHKAGTLAQFRVKTLDIAVARFEEWLLSQPELVEQVKRELRGKVLGCWCRPKDGFRGRILCHGQVLAAVANDCKPEDFD